MSHVSSCHFFLNLVSSISRKFRQNERITLALRSKLFVGLYLAPNYKTCHSTSVSARVVIRVACNRSVTLPETPAGDSRSARQAIWSWWKPETECSLHCPAFRGICSWSLSEDLASLGLWEKSQPTCVQVWIGGYWSISEKNCCAIFKQPQGRRGQRVLGAFVASSFPPKGGMWD